MSSDTSKWDSLISLEKNISCLPFDCVSKFLSSIFGAKFSEPSLGSQHQDVLWGVVLSNQHTHRDAKSGEQARAIFFAPTVLFFGLCTRSGCALVLIFGSSCANVWPKQFGQLTQLCLVSGD